MESTQHPFTILALAPFCPEADTSSPPEPLIVDPSDPDSAFRQLKVTFSLPLTVPSGESQHIPLTFNQLRDFHPDRMMRRSGFLSGYLEALRFLNTQQAKKMSVSALRQALGKWPQLSAVPLTEATPKSSGTSGSTLDNILEMVALPDGGDSGDRPRDAVDWIDAQLRQHLTRIFSSPVFQTIESSWRGLQYLLRQRRRDQAVRFKIVPVIRDTLIASLDSLTETLSGEPPSVIIIDLPMNSSARDMDALHRIARLAESLLVPAVVWVNPAFFHLDSWEALSRLPYIPHHLEGAPYAKWRHLRSSATADWLAVTCNRFLTRFPYGTDNPIREMRFFEPGCPWISPVWAAAALMVRSMAVTGWPTHIIEHRRVQLEDLALCTGKGSLPSATETLFTDDRLRQFVKAGIMPLSTLPRKDVAFLPAETTVGRFSLSYATMLSLIAQLILWCRDQAAPHLTPEQLVPELNRLVQDYWEFREMPIPGDIEISAGTPDGEGRIPLTFQLIPSRKAMAVPSPIRLEFTW